MNLPPPLETASAEAVFRYQVVSDVVTAIGRGTPRKQAVSAAAARRWMTPTGGFRAVAVRTVYRWVAAYEAGGVAALRPAARARRETTAVPHELMQFVAAQKELDIAVSIPEILRRARELGIVDADARLDRSTVYRAAKRADIEVARRKGPVERDMRRFAYAHRMDCVLCDGKHFRAGAHRARRVALFFVDDATRFGLHVVVGTSESAALFLRGLYQMVRHHGLMQIAYMDHGPGFDCGDSAQVVRNLGALLIHGQSAYPEGHGKIERFNQTAKSHVLRGLDKRPDVDPDCGALQLRLEHFLRQQYNHTPHDSLDNATPHERFMADAKSLSFPDSDAELRRRFVVHVERTASKDHVVSIDGVAYEVPRGLAQRRLSLHHRLLDDTYAVVVGGELVEISRVDVVANARSRRARPSSVTTDDGAAKPLPPSAADLAFSREFGPVADADGGVKAPTPNGDS